MASTIIRCAVYTRKSTEEGLEQAFNSLDAQREACAAYIASQRHEGWTMVPDHYDDGGISGGTMERPGLKQLLADVAAGKVQVIAVYKVDRLTRSLADFARIVDILDTAGASFVSVTQAFNTTTSMGRLTLNVLLSFAQFEREVTGERIRDKIAASKKKGMWMGGNPPLGYDVRDRKLVVNGAEAQQVRHIFQRYLELRSVGQLATDLARSGIRSKHRVSASGRIFGNVMMRKGALAWMLQNRLYLGDVHHQGSHYPGEHEAIIEPALWDQVQAQLAVNRVEHRTRAQAVHPSLLAGMLVGPHGRPMTPTHAQKDGRRYRYYISRIEPDDGSQVLRLAAREIEATVTQALISCFRDRPSLARLVDEADSCFDQLFRSVAAYIEILEGGSASAQRGLLLELGCRIEIGDGEIVIGLSLPTGPTRFVLPVTLTRVGIETRMILDNEVGNDARCDPALIGLLVRAHQAQATLTIDVDRTKAAKDQLSRLARLTYLAPDIVGAILAGRQPASLTARTLARVGKLPIDWVDQRRALGF